jgi:hypothetical protein
MKNWFPPIGLSILTVLSMAMSCQSNEETKDSFIELTPEANFGGSIVGFNNPNAIDASTDVLIFELKFYLSKIRAVATDNREYELVDYCFFDFRNPDFTKCRMKLPEGVNVKGLRLNVGLDSTQNYSDPASFNQSHPLSAARGMYWTWATQYRFLLIEGKANQTGLIGSSSDQGISYHPGGNHLYIEDVFLPLNLGVGNGSTRSVLLKLDITKWFNGVSGAIDPITESNVHAAPEDQALGKRFIENFSSSMRLQ